MNAKKLLQTFFAVLLAILLFFAVFPSEFHVALADSNQVIADGTYYIRNAKKSGDDALYVQQDNNTMSSYYDDGNITELWKYSGTESQRWTFSALNNKTIGTEKTYNYKLSHLDLIKNSETIALIKNIIDGTAPTYQTSTATINIGTETENDDLRITMVTKNIKSISVYNSEGYELYSQGEKLYYDDLNGVTHEAGTIWYINDTSYQYILYNDSYTIESINCGKNPSIRIDYCDYGLSDTMVKFTDFNENSMISINKRSVSSLPENNITIGG